MLTLQIMILLAFINALFLTDLIFIKYLHQTNKEDKYLSELKENTIQEEYEDVEIDEFDDRIASIKQEIQEKRDKGIFETNQVEVITEEYEKELYNGLDG